MIKPQLTSYTIVRNLKVIPLRSGKRQGCSLLPLLFNIELKVLAREIRKTEKLGNRKKKSVQIGKEKIKLSIFADGMILYIENTKDSSPKKELLAITNTR